jgi:hypothetical protein
MESKTKKRATKKASSKSKKPTVSKVQEVPPGICVNCAPLGYTQVLAMLLVSVFSLVTILSIASYKIDQQNAELSAQDRTIAALQSLVEVE